MIERRLRRPRWSAWVCCTWVKRAQPALRRRDAAHGARACLQSRVLLLLDEPTASADIQAMEQIEQAILDYAKQTGCTLVFSSHAPSQAMRLSTRVLALDGGRIGESGRDRAGAAKSLAESTRVFLKSWRL
ncbi:MAG: hypothetical protein R2881_03225 [Eubacteriales bacterium]